MITKKHAVDDDYESLRNVVTESNVDYLSYKFDEMDLAASWRVLTKQKLTIVNGLRLENASWRTWAKQRNNLKTVSPDTLNWLKDSDVTWLYGPLHTVIKNMDEQDRYAKPKKATTEETLGLMTSSSQKEESKPVVAVSQPKKPLKSALKKVTMSDLLKRSASELQVNHIDSDQDTILSANQQIGEFSPSVIASHRQPKLRFNQYVEQCVALPTPTRKSKLSHASNYDSEEENYDPGEDSDADSMIMLRRPSKLRSIKKIEPALLKTNSKSDHYSSSDDDDNGNFISTSYSRRRSSSGFHHKKHSTKTTDAETWDAESAESDALVQHIISVSKGKERQVSRDPAADRIPTNYVNYESDKGSNWGQEKSDYEYHFDDNDWDTHSEHVEDDPYSFTAHHEYPPIAPSEPVGCQVYKEPTHHQHRPTLESNTSHTQISNIQAQLEDSSTTSSSLFTSIAHWASSHFWPSSNNNVNNSK